MRGFLAVAVVLAALAPSAALAAPLGFHPAQYIDDSYPGGEPVLFTDTVHHRILYSSHEGTTHIYRPGLAAPSTLPFFSEYRNQVKMWASDDGGQSFQRINYSVTGFSTDPTKQTGFSDPDFAQDESGRIYNTGINLATQAIFSSPDGGRTWDKGTPQCRPGDRPWLAGGKAEEVFFATNDLASGLSHYVYQSTDGGSSCPTEGIQAFGDDWTGVGKLYRWGDYLIEPAQFDGGGLGIDVWKRGEERFTGYKAVSGTSLYAHWPAISIDGAGTVYLVWDTNPELEGTAGGCEGSETPAPNQIQMVYTKDLGKTWSAPVTVDAPAGKRVLWPWIAAGDAGKVSVVWYETDKVVDLACEKAALSVKAATILNASDDAARTIETVDAVGRPISINNICQSGTTCVATGEDRRLGDFFTNAIDERGCVMIATSDTMSKDPVTGGERVVSLPLFVRQKSGPRLIGSGDCSEAPGTAPRAPGIGLPSARRCVSRRNFDIRLRNPRGQQLDSARVYVNGKRVRVRRSGGRLRARVDLRGLPKGRFTVRVVGFTKQGRRVTSTRRYRTCIPRR